MNMSELDALLVCLGNCGGAAAWPCLLHKLKTLPEEAEFSHVRALTMSIESLYARCPNGDVAPIVASILDREGYQGHVQLDVSDAQSALSENINENRVRDDTLRELHLARLLFHCGDHGQRGEVLLRQYAKDCRGHFARHANALLSR
ncbi:hypothetical protein [Puniceicoccus vermicola]|uniref:Uncharacterized protein n=1 Tax=Puniceicoccus vermicola TaxID=388746 RepID=A0A7X1E555_9BACT|nr:hypothetical protein [Puniceicoccus vermicola]MBC2602779.1 hypothetical protein [Puniceicoccus vermicola]